MSNGSATIRVMIVDDHTIVREGLATLLDVFPDLELVAEAGNGLEAIRLCEEQHPDVVLMDMLMPEMDGISATRAIREQFPDVQVLALTSFNEKEYVTGAIEAGAIGYLLKDIEAANLAAAIRSASAGQPTLSPEATRVLIHATTQPAPPGHDLTERELEVLALLVKGLNNAQIADVLTVSPSTIKNHVSSILSKLGVATRTEAAALAIQKQIVQLT